MARKETPAPVSKEPVFLDAEIAQDFSAANALALVTRETDARVQALATQMGYTGSLSVGALEDEIRFYQQRSVEALLETGRRLLLLREVTVHGNSSQSGTNSDFDARVALLGISRSSAYRFMQAAAKTSKSANLAALSAQVKSASVFLELITHDDDVIENLSELDDFDRMSASELRAKAREMAAEKDAVEEVLTAKNASMDKLRAQLKRIDKLPPDEALANLQREATAMMNDALGAVRGGMRQALIALKNHGDDDHSLFMAGLVGQVQADLAALREEFNLPDVSNAADAQLAAEVAEWSKD